MLHDPPAITSAQRNTLNKERVVEFFMGFPVAPKKAESFSRQTSFTKILKVRKPLLSPRRIPARHCAVLSPSKYSVQSTLHAPANRFPPKNEGNEHSATPDAWKTVSLRFASAGSNPNVGVSLRFVFRAANSGIHGSSASS